ncbi:unnamed protein product [Gongylonema pulchrum]|uniref:14_3_3 domain-containing protein n=1 Tax=Gongylonema pulchrum TaxID=637853 RepID=A0A183CY26_9BILA|nr:unnamed protein product [Gongylonema pulchrum]
MQNSGHPTKLNSCVREEERENVWCRLKELYLELFLSAQEVWQDKNTPGRLAVYASLSKLVKFYLDVADEETMKICQDAASEAKFLGKGALDEEQHRDTSARINEIRKNIGDAERGKKDLADSS